MHNAAVSLEVNNAEQSTVGRQHEKKQFVCKTLPSSLGIAQAHRITFLDKRVSNLKMEPTQTKMSISKCTVVNGMWNGFRNVSNPSNSLKIENIAVFFVF